MSGAPPKPQTPGGGLLKAASICFALVCAVTLVAYARSFHSPFHLDDYSHIVGNPVMTAPSVEAFVQFGRARIVPFASLALNYRLGGEDPFGYHIVNFAVHLLATLGVFNLALALCRTPRVRDTWLARQQLAFATGAALVFACHPIQIQGVTYIVQRMSSMAAMFYVGSVLLYVRARNAQLGLGPGSPATSYAGAALLAVGAFFSKENAASLPLAMLLAELTFYPGDRSVRRLLRLAPFAVLVLSIPITWKVLGRRPGTQPLDAPLAQQTQDLVYMLVHRASRGSPISTIDYLLTQAVVIPRYLGLVVVPWGFNIEHDVPVVSGLSLPVLAGFVLLVALLACGLYALRRAPVAGFGILWLFIALSVESSVLPIRDVMVEHRMYLAMPGVALLAGWTFASALRRRRSVALAAAASCVLLLVSLTFARNEVWRTPLGLWRDALAKSPNKARVHANVGTALYDLGRLDEAIAEYCQALALDPTHLRAQSNLETALDEQLEKMVDEGQEIEAVIGPDGSFQMVRPDPCRPAKPEEKKGEG